jgi:hypothetical protein
MQHIVEIPFTSDASQPSTWQNVIVGVVNIHEPCTLQCIEFVGPCPGSLAWVATKHVGHAGVVGGAPIETGTPALVAAMGDVTPQEVVALGGYWSNWSAVGEVWFLQALAAGESVTVRVESAPCDSTVTRYLRLKFEV